MPVFVYGSLRVGSWNYKSDGVDSIIPDCHIDGALYWAWVGSYPVAKLDEPGEMVGDLLSYDPFSRTYESVCRMEEGAGYQLRPVKVRTPSGDVLDAYAWHYVSTPRGPKIESGDWRSAYEAHQKSAAYGDEEEDEFEAEDSPWS